ncbi:MAG: YraN family protein [Ignavibacteriales bacterium]|nr:YraN family protein [Ignavibacteriales bacterium]
MSENKKDLGKKGEDLACKFLEEQEYEIIQRNYTYEHGEIDIIAKSPDNCLVFVEVRTKTNTIYGKPEDSVTIKKRKQIRKIAEAYLWEKNIDNIECRLDVMGILFLEGEKPRIEHFIDAF